MQLYEAEWKRGKDDSVWKFVLWADSTDTHGSVGEWLKEQGTPGPEELRQAIARSEDGELRVLLCEGEEGSGLEGGADLEEWRSAAGVEFDAKDGATWGDVLVLPTVEGPNLAELILLLRPVRLVHPEGKRRLFRAPLKSTL